MSLHVACSYHTVCTRHTINLQGDKNEAKPGMSLSLSLDLSQHQHAAAGITVRESVQPILANELALGMRGSREHDIADHPICMAIDLSVVKR
jgi:hypothetical protein